MYKKTFGFTKNPIRILNSYGHSKERHRGAANFASAVISLLFSPSQKDSGNAAADSIERMSSDRKAAGYFMHLLISILNTPSPPSSNFFFKVRHNHFHAAITQARFPVYESHLSVHNFSPQSICLASTSTLMDIVHKSWIATV